MKFYERGLEILRNCKDDLEAESFIIALKPHLEYFESLKILSQDGGSGVQLRLALLAEISQSPEDIIISSNQLNQINLLLEQVRIFKNF